MDSNGHQAFEKGDMEKDDAIELSSCNSQKRINQLERDFQDTQIYTEKLKEELNVSRNELSLYREKIEAQNLMLQDEQSRRFDLESELDKVREDSKSKAKECIDLQYSLALARNQELQLKADVDEASRFIAQYKVELATLHANIASLTENLSMERAKVLQASAEGEDTLHQYNNVQSLLKNKIQENNVLEENLMYEREALAKVNQHLFDTNKALSRAEIETTSLRNDMYQIIHTKEQLDREARILELENQEKENKIRLLEQKLSDMDKVSIQYECAIKRLEQELTEASVNNTNQLLSIQQYKEICSNQAVNLAQQQALNRQLQNEKRLLDDDLQQLSIEYNHKESEYLGQLHAFENLQQENVTLLKDLSISEDALKNSNYKIQSLIGEIDSCHQQNLFKEHDKIEMQLKLEKTMNLLDEKVKELSHLKEKQLQYDSSIIAKHDTGEPKKLNIVESEFSIALADRNSLETELTQSKNENVLLGNKINSLENSIQKQKKEYLERMNDIKLLRQTIKDLQREIYSLKKCSIISKQLIRKDAELIDEQRKVQILWDELEKPLNVHRWRQLEGTDPSTLEMIMKIQTLQKRLIKKTEENMEKDTLLMEKERQFNELQRQLFRRTDLDSKQQSNEAQADIRMKARQMKAMAGELNMNQLQIHEYSKEINKLNSQLHDLKEKYFEQKRREAVAEVRDLLWLHETGQALFPKSRENTEKL